MINTETDQCTIKACREASLVTYLIGRIEADDRATTDRTQTKDFIFVDYEIYNYVNKILDHSLYLHFRDKNRVNRGKYVLSEESSSHLNSVLNL